MLETLVELFWDVDNFCIQFLPIWHKQLLSCGEKRRHRHHVMHLSEMMTILILFHQSGYRDFKTFYKCYVTRHLCQEFPRLLSYSRFVRLIPNMLIPLAHYLKSRKASVTGISFIDSTPLAVCHNKRIERHRVFAGVAKRGRTSMGWFYGLKLHLIVNDEGGLLSYALTPGNRDDRKPVKKLAKNLWGKLFGDKGYLSKQLFEELQLQGLELITTYRKNMKNTFINLFDKLLLRKRFIIETINDQLKNISQIEHTRHRSLANCVVNIISGLIAYTWQTKKPSIHLNKKQNKLLTAFA